MRGRFGAIESAAIGGSASICVHALVVALLFTVPGTAGEKELAAKWFPLEAAPSGRGVRGARSGAHPDRQAPLVAGGPQSAQNIDARRIGGGGDAVGAAEGILLLQRDEGVLLFDSPLNNIAAAQSQRIRTARDRATRERRRATPNPADEVFLASGEGRHRERRPIAPGETAPGSRVAPVPSEEGSAASPLTPGGADVRHEASSALGARGDSTGQHAAGPAGAEASAGRGILNGSGERHRASAPVAHARPTIDRGPAAAQAERREARVRDDTDSELLARRLMSSMVEASRRTGPRVGEGRGGIGGGGPSGSGEERTEGGRAHGHAPGAGTHGALDTRDSRYVRWVVQQRRRIYRRLIYPRERALAMDQDALVYRIWVRRDGTLARAPQAVRESQYRDFNRAARAAIASATPFAPVPEEIAPGQVVIPMLVPINFEHPMF